MEGRNRILETNLDWPCQCGGANKAAGARENGTGGHGGDLPRACARCRPSCCWRGSRDFHSDVFYDWQEAVADSFTSFDEIQTGSKLSSCSYFRACIDKTLRLCPAGLFDNSHNVLSGGIYIDGDFIPAGVQVGTSPWSLHQNEDIYGDPYVFRPERWIVDESNTGVTADEVPRARTCWQPFGQGFSKCIGMGLVMMELKIILARTLFQMDVAVPSDDGSRLDEGSSEAGWGRRNRKVYQFTDAFLSIMKKKI